MTSRFRFAARYGLLTYSQIGDRDSDRLAWEINDLLGELGAECIVGRERHRDGGLHLHAFFMFERKFESRNVRIFDVDGLHPNILRGYSTPEKGITYASKDGDIVAGGLDISGCGVKDGPTRNVWAEIIMAVDREQFFEACARLAPRALCCSYTSLRCYADWKYREDPEPYATPSGLSFDTSGTPELDQWVQESLGGTRGGKCPPTAEDTFSARV